MAQASGAARGHGTVLGALSDPGSHSGDDFSINAVATDGNTAVVGAEGTDFARGAAYIYVRGARGWPASPTVSLADPQATNSDIFGQSVAVRGRVIVVGAYGADVAYVYVRGPRGWPTSPTYTLADPGGQPGDQFGTSAVTDGSTIAVGAEEVTSAGGATGAGAVYIYRLRSSGPPALIASLPDPAAVAFDLFGASLALSGDSLAVGAYNGDAVYLFQRRPSGWPTAPTATFADPAAAPGDGFGGAVGLSGPTLIAGAGPVNTAYIYTRGSLGWPSAPTTTLADPGGGGSDDFGVSVAVDGRAALVGDDNANSAGAVYTYLRGSSGWPASPVSTLRDPGTGSGAFGQSVALSNGTAIGGAWLTLGDRIVGGVGAAYIFIP